MTCPMHMPVSRLHVHNGGDSKIPDTLEGSPCLNLPVLLIELSGGD
jgi:hypothetical protein